MSTGATVIVGSARDHLCDQGRGAGCPGRARAPTWFTSVVVLLAPALLAALVATQALADGDELAIGADTPGVAAGGLAAWRTGSIIACVLIAPAVTAALRAL